MPGMTVDIWTFADGYSEQYSRDNLPYYMPIPGVAISTEPGDMYRMFCLNCGRFPTNITGYRRALAYALDKGAVVQASTGGLAWLQDCALPVDLGNWTFEDQLLETYYARDITSANSSLEAAGFRDLDGNGWRDYDADNSTTLTSGDILDVDFKIDLFHSEGHAPSGNAVEIAMQSLRLCGIMADVDPQDYYEMLDRISAGDYWLSCFTLTNVNSADLLYELFHSSTESNQWYFEGWTNATYDQYAENLMAAPTLEEVNHWAWKCQELLWYEQPMIVCYNDVYIYEYRVDVWEGYVNMACRNRLGANPWTWIHIRLKEEAGGPFGCYPTEYVCVIDYGMDTTNVIMSNSDHADLIFMNIYSKLRAIDPFTWEPVPDLAYNWTLETTVASGDIQDGQKWTFNLYENVTWHDGTPLTSADVAYTLDTIARYDPHREERVKHIYRIESPNDHIVEIYSNQTGYLEIFNALDYYILPKHVWEPQFNFTSWVPATPTDLIGSGPYKWGNHEAGQFVSLERYSDWHFGIEQPTRILCNPPIQWVTFILIIVGCIVILLQVGIILYLVHRRSRSMSIKNSKNYNFTNWREI